MRGGPEDKELQQSAKAANEAQRREERENSRLVVVDAGLDRDALRRTYPDRMRYAMVRGRVKPENAATPTHMPRGRIVSLSVTDINVPAALRSVVGDGRPINMPGTENTSSPYEMAVSYGKRLEPWIAGAAKSARSE